MHRLKLGTLPVFALLASTGCIVMSADDDPCAGGCSSGTCGEQGELRFVDASDDPIVDLGQREVRPVAVGSTYALDVTPPDDTEDRLVPLEAQLDGSALVLSTIGQPLVLRAADSPGTSRLTVLTEDGLEDTIELETRTVATGEIRESVPEMLAALAGLFDDEQPNEFALMPGAALDYSVQWYDADGERLAGYGLGSWALPDGFTATVLGERGDAIEVTAPIDANAGTWTIAAADDVTAELVIRTVDDADTVRFVDLSEQEIGDRIEVPLGGSFEVFVEARDADGRVLVPPASERATLTLDAGAAQIIDVSQQPMLDWFIARGVATGTAMAEVRYAGFTRTVTVDVTAN